MGASVEHMTFQPLDVAAFAGFLLLVVGVSLYASRGSRNAAAYFLAGRNLPWRQGASILQLFAPDAVRSFVGRVPVELFPPVRVSAATPPAGLPVPS